MLASNRGDHHARPHRLFDDASLLGCRPTATPAGPGDHLQPAHHPRLKHILKHRHKTIRVRDRQLRPSDPPREGGFQTPLTVYVFRAKRADRVKLVFWDGTGVVLVAKRLEEGQFRWPRIEDGVMRLTATELQALLEGLDWRRVHEPRQVTVPAVPS